MVAATFNYHARNREADNCIAGAHGAAWVMWDPDEGVVEFRKTDYNRLHAAKDIAAAGLPLESALRLLTDDEKAFLVG